MQGRDPFFPGWPDSLQLNYGHPAVQATMTEELRKIAQLCDGVRCDMAMLILPDVFERTWGIHAEPFWPRAIETVRRDRLPVVHRRGTRPPRASGGPVFSDGVLWQWPAVHGHDVCLGSARRRYPAAHAVESSRLIDSGVYTFARAVMYRITNVYAIKVLRAQYPGAPVSLSALLAALFSIFGILALLAAIFRQ